MKLPERFTRKDIEWLEDNYCSHGHTYLSHLHCYFNDHGTQAPSMVQLKIAFLDIETSDFKADIGYMLSWAISNNQNDDIDCDCITQDEIIQGSFDRRIVDSLMRELEKYDVVVTYWGTGFDLPFLRTRAVVNGHRMPLEYGSCSHYDLYYTVRRKFKLRKNSLKIACEVLLGESNKTDVDILLWRRARVGDTLALEYVLDHNVKDVIDTKALYNKVCPYRKAVFTSV